MLALKQPSAVSHQPSVGKPQASRPLAPPPSAARSRLSPPPTAREGEGGGVVVRMKLVGANPQPQVMGLEELPGKVNYFRGNDPTGAHPLLL